MVAKMLSGWVVMGERQVFPGYCMLIPDPVVPHLNALSVVGRGYFLSDMALVGDALMAATAALRINYAIYGNLDPALHAHVFPRRADEPPSTRTAQPWALDWSQAPQFSDALHGDLKRRIGEYLRAAIRS
jgi:diadenosine tetraphosphate (Ap4A) HIT family hydrolase